MLIRPFALERWGDTLGFCWQPVWAAGRVQALPLVNFPGQRSFAVMPSSRNSRTFFRGGEADPSPFV